MEIEKDIRPEELGGITNDNCKYIIPKPQQLICDNCQSRKQQLLSMIQIQSGFTLNLLCQNCGVMFDLIFNLENNILKKSKKNPSYIG